MNTVIANNHPSKCNRCAATIFWQTAKSGKRYPTNSEKRGDFHVCAGSAPAAQKPRVSKQSSPTPLDMTLGERVTALESQLAGLIATVVSLRKLIPISDQDVEF